VKPSTMLPTPADANLGSISVCLVNKHSACQLTSHCSEVNGFDCDSLPEPQPLLFNP